MLGVSRVQGAATNSWAIVAIDGAPLRRKAQRDYQKTLRDLDSAKALLAAFHERDQPLFSRWINQNFGALLTDIRELQAKLLQAQQLIFEVDQEYFSGGHTSVASAYCEVMRRRTQPEPGTSGDPGDEEEDDEEDFQREFKEAFGKDPEDFWAHLGEGANERTHPHRPEQRNGPSSSNRRLKELYRTLARRLHPDKAANLAPAEMEWWYQTQAAYESGNLEQMEMILTLVEIHDNGTRETSISALAKLTSDFKKRLRALKRQISELRRETAWNFANRVDHSDLRHQFLGSLTLEREEIASHLAECNFQIAKWERAAARFLRPRRRTHSEF